MSFLQLALAHSTSFEITENGRQKRSQPAVGLVGHSSLVQDPTAGCSRSNGRAVQTQHLKAF